MTQRRSAAAKDLTTDYTERLRRNRERLARE
jgi:hypothetical protein